MDHFCLIDVDLNSQQISAGEILYIDRELVLCFHFSDDPNFRWPDLGTIGSSGSNAIVMSTCELSMKLAPRKMWMIS